MIKTLKGDFFGGITAGIIALPLALAFGASSGLGAAAGLYGAIFLCFFASLIGGTKTQISGPTGPMTVVVASIIAINPGNLKIVFAAMFLAGIIQILFGILKLGKFIHYVPYPVISGFMSGIGVIIILLQLNPLLGLELQGSTIDSIKNLIIAFPDYNLKSLILGLLTLAIIIFTPKKISKVIPSTLIALIVVTIISVIYNFNTATIGTIPSGFPSIQLAPISFQEFTKIIPIAFTLALLGSIDSLLTSLVADSITKTKHQSNRELIGQGLGNLVCSIFGGLVGAGATMRTVVNVKSGAKTQLSGIIQSIFLVLVLLFLAPYASMVPLAVLAGILIKVGIDIIDYKLIRIISEIPKHDLIVMLLVFFITVFDDLILAVGIGIVLASLLFASRVAKRMEVDINTINDYESEEFDSREKEIEEKTYNHIQVINISGIFFFGSASMVAANINGTIDTKCVILNCKNIQCMDLSAMFTLEDIILRLKDKKIEVKLVLKDKIIADTLLRMGILKYIKRQDICLSFKNAEIKAQKYLNKLNLSNNNNNNSDK